MNDKLWKIKHWLKYKPSIYFYSAMAKISHVIVGVIDKLGYLLLGKEKWEKAKKEQEDD
jgi:hypothetical protein